MLPQLLSVAILFSQAFAGPVELRESYATGVGAGVADRSVFRSICLRFNQAYPRVLARDSKLPGPANEARLINNACFGQTIERILETQFKDVDSGDFKAFGKPQFATISAAGDDIEFKELVLSCIYEFPTKPRLCQDQIDRSAQLLQAPEFVPSIQKLINTTLTKGLVNYKDFRVYYVGYAEFFNTQKTTPDFCSQKTWSHCKFYQRGCEKLPLTLELRNKLNVLASVLNLKIQVAIDSFKDTNKNYKGQPLVKFVAIDELVNGHRYCEQGKEEPVANDDDIWFFQWLDKATNNDDKHKFYNAVANRFSNTPNIETLQDNQLNGKITISAEDFLKAEIAVANAKPSLAKPIHAEDLIIDRVKSFHPKIHFHALIEQKIRDLVKADF